jgi:dolichol-phosphate mannosyltransferase
MSLSMQAADNASMLDEHRLMARPESQFRTVGIIVPTRNESVNVIRLMERLAAALEPLGCNWHVLFVDDSEDETPVAVRRLARDGWPAKMIHRPRGFRMGGLSGAVVSGIVNCEAEILVVMDADLQHPPEVVVDLVAPLLDGRSEISVATRYAGGGAGGGLDGSFRKVVSRASRVLTRALFDEVRQISDPCGGFFAFNRSVVEGVTLQPGGFKILMEILVRGNWTRSHEVPYLFASRLHGDSKTSLKEGIAFLGHMRRLRMTRDRRPTGPVADVIDITDRAIAGSGATPKEDTLETTPTTGVPFWLLVAALHLRPERNLSTPTGSAR